MDRPTCLYRYQECLATIAEQKKFLMHVCTYSTLMMVWIDFIIMENKIVMLALIIVGENKWLSSEHITSKAEQGEAAIGIIQNLAI